MLLAFLPENRNFLKQKEKSVKGLVSLCGPYSDFCFRIASPLDMATIFNRASCLFMFGKVAQKALDSFFAGYPLGSSCCKLYLIQFSLSSLVLGT